MIKAEFLCDNNTRSRGRMLLDALHASALANGVDPRMTCEYEGGKRLLLMWGPGHPTHFAAFKRHKKAGGIVVAFDMGYWDQGRGSDVLGMNRVTVDALHPQALVMRLVWPDENALDKTHGTPQVLRDDYWDPDGPIVLVGLGPKSCDQFGLRVGEWEERTLRALRERLGARPRILLRPKPLVPYRDIGIPLAEGPLDHVLRGAAAVVCRHSNVAVDAIKVGVPAYCDDGAARAISSPVALASPAIPPPHATMRATFVRRLSWYQWTIDECARGEAWGPILRMVSEVEAIRREQACASI